jgi:hypothetical protein
VISHVTIFWPRKAEARTSPSRHRLILFPLQSCLSHSPFPHPGRLVRVKTSDTAFLSFLQDLGKSSNDLLGKDFPFQGTNLEVKTKAPSGVTFKVAGGRDSKSSAINSEIEAKYADYKHGAVFTQTWTTANVLRSQLELENQIAKGLKLDIATSLQPDKGTKNALINAVYKQSGLHSRAVVDVFKVGNPAYMFFFRPITRC